MVVTPRGRAGAELHEETGLGERQTQNKQKRLSQSTFRNVSLLKAAYVEISQAAENEIEVQLSSH